MEKKPQQSESRDLDKYIVRFPEGMRDKIAEAARSHQRSMNAEIIARLQRSFDFSLNEKTDALDTLGILSASLLLANNDLIDEKMREDLRRTAMNLAKAVATKTALHAGEHQVIPRLEGESEDEPSPAKSEPAGREEPEQPTERIIGTKRREPKG